MLLSCGIDPDRSTLFVQSHVTAHAEACWLLNCITPLGWLYRMTQFKDKSARQETILTGLLDYPVLQACDIMLYDADEVPVGEDQRQHIELTRDIGQRFNHMYDTPFFVIPEAKIPEAGARVMGLDDPENKMSKSMTHIRGHAVHLLDDPKEIMRSFRRAKTDSGNEIIYSDDPGKAGVNNLLEIYEAVTGKGKDEVLADFAHARGYGDLKTGVGEAVIEAVTPVREQHDYLMKDTAELDRLLERGADAARAHAQPKVDGMKELMGLVLPAKS